MTSTGERLATLGLVLPGGHTLVSMAERPDLVRVHDALNGSAWPEFMLQDPTVGAYWGRMFDELAAFQCSLLDADGIPVAGLNAMPIAWDGTEDGLPDGWDDQVVRTFEQRDAGIAPDTMGAVQVVVRPDRQGSGLAGVMVTAMQALAREQGLSALIACVRPTAKDQDPFADIDEYAFRVREDGLPLDPWIRLHVRLGGHVVRGAPASMRMEGSVAEWRRWTGLPLPVSGLYAPAFAAAPVDIDLEADRGVYLDPNVWVVHWLI
ncbi:MAG: N-acetyltransferase [Chloroflexota bacterium]